MRTTSKNINDLFYKHFNLVYYTLNKYFNRIINKIKDNTGLEYEDLVQIGSIGLLKACQRFDPSIAKAFSTYAVPLIKGEIMLAIQRGDKVKIPRSIKDIFNKIRREGNDELGALEVAKKYGINLKMAEDSLNFIEQCVSLEEPTSENRKTCYKDLLEDDVDIASEIGDKTIIDDFLSTLSAKERLVWKLYTEGERQEDISRLIGTSQPQVSRIIAGIWKKAENYGKINGLRAS